MGEKIKTHKQRNKQIKWSCTTRSVFLGSLLISQAEIVGFFQDGKTLMGRGQVVGRNGWGRTSGPLGLGHVGLLLLRGVLKISRSAGHSGLRGAREKAALLLPDSGTLREGSACTPKPGGARSALRKCAAPRGSLVPGLTGSGRRSHQPLAWKRKKSRCGKMGSGDLGWLVVSKLDNSALSALSGEHAPRRLLILMQFEDTAPGLLPSHGRFREAQSCGVLSHSQ